MKRFLTCFVVLAAFALRAWTAETGRAFDRWEPEIRAFEESDKTNPPPRNPILFVGSSGIRLWTTLQKDFPDHTVMNRGFGGCHIEDCTHFASRIVLPYKPRAIFFRCGGNDLWDGKTAEQVFNDFKAFVASVHSQLPETDIFFIAWNPTLSRWSQVDQEKELNRRVREFAGSTPHVKYIETVDLFLGKDGKPKADLLHEDKLHFSPEGYRLLAERIRPHLP